MNGIILQNKFNNIHLDINIESEIITIEKHIIILSRYWMLSNAILYSTVQYEELQRFKNRFMYAWS